MNELSQEQLSSPEKSWLGNCFLSKINKADLLWLITSWIQNKEKNHHITAINVSKLVAIQSDQKLAGFIGDSSINIADGSPVYLATHLTGNPIPERITGVELMEGLLELTHENAWRAYFFGTTSAVLDKVLARCKKEFPKLIVAGSRNGYFTKDEEAAIVVDIAASDPDIVFVALGVPQKEYFVDDHKEQLNASLILPVGGAFDVYAGLKSRAPEWVQRFGIEWLWRSFYDRSRAGMVLRSFFPFISLVVKDIIRQRFSKSR